MMKLKLIILLLLASVGAFGQVSNYDLNYANVRIGLASASTTTVRGKFTLSLKPPLLPSNTSIRPFSLLVRDTTSGDVKRISEDSFIANQLGNSGPYTQNAVFNIQGGNMQSLNVANTATIGIVNSTTATTNSLFISATPASGTSNDGILTRNPVGGGVRMLPYSTFAPSSGSANYIQNIPFNGTTQAASINIDGNLIAINNAKSSLFVSPMFSTAPTYDGQDGVFGVRVEHSTNDLLRISDGKILRKLNFFDNTQDNELSLKNIFSYSYNGSSRFSVATSGTVNIPVQPATATTADRVLMWSGGDVKSLPTSSLPVPNLQSVTMAGNTTSNDVNISSTIANLGLTSTQPGGKSFYLSVGYNDATSLSIRDGVNQRILINSIGNVGIGNTNPQSAIDVTGSGRGSTNDGNANTWVRNQDVGKTMVMNASGNGALTTISIAHGLSGITTNSAVLASANNSASAGYNYVTVDTTNVNFIYTVAPASGTNNLRYSVTIK